MSHTPYSEVVSNIEINNGEDEKTTLTLADEENSIYTLISSVLVYGEEFLIYIDVIDDEKNFFANLIHYDSIDNEENTPLFNKLLQSLEEEGYTALKASFNTPLLFDYIAGIAKTSFLRYSEEISNRTVSLYDFVKNFGMDATEANNIALAISKNQREIKKLKPVIEKITLHDLISIPMQRKNGVWQYNVGKGDISKREFVDALLERKSGDTMDLF